MRSKLLVAVGAVTLAGLSAAIAPAAQGASNTVKHCFLYLPSSTLEVTEGITVSGHQAAGWVRIEKVSGPYDAPTVTRDFVVDADGNRWHGPGGPVPIDWSWGWVAAPERTEVSGISATGGGDTCTIWS